MRDRFQALRETLAARIESGQRAGRIAADIDPLDAAALVIAASDGLQIQWLLDPGAVDVSRSLSILEPLSAGARDTFHWKVFDRRRIVAAERSALARWRWSVTAAFGLGGITISAWGPRLPAIKAGLGISTATIGLLLAGVTVRAILGLLGLQAPRSCTGWAAAGPSRQRCC